MLFLMTPVWCIIYENVKKRHHWDDLQCCSNVKCEMLIYKNVKKTKLFLVRNNISFILFGKNSSFTYKIPFFEHMEQVGMYAIMDNWLYHLTLKSFLFFFLRTSWSRSWLRPVWCDLPRYHCQEMSWTGSAPYLVGMADAVSHQQSPRGP